MIAFICWLSTVDIIMLSINLLSPEKKQEVARQMMLVLLQYLISWILIAVCGVGGVLLSTKVIMQNSFNDAVAQGTLVTQEYGVLNQKVHFINQKIDFFTGIQNKFTTWSPRLAALTSLTPKNITLYALNANNITRTVQITGHAGSRENLLLYKQNLEQSSLVSSVTLPIENILESKNIDFNITASLILQ